VKKLRTTDGFVATRHMGSGAVQFPGGTSDFTNLDGVTTIVA
jgi:hypothetical protein